MSDLATALAGSAAQKQAAVWEPTPMLRALASKHFVRVQDERGQTSHFTLTTYRQLSNPPVQTDPNDPSSALVHGVDLTEGHHEGTELPDNEALELVRQQAYEQGLNDGRQQALADHLAQSELQSQASEAEKSEKTIALLEKIQASIEGLHEDPAARYEPLKRLALHLAEQLVLTELSLSPGAVQNLIQRCVDALDQPSAPEVLVELNPDDMALVQAAGTDGAPSHWRIQANPDLLPGSVQASANDATVRDLVEHRLQHLAQSLLEHPQRWQAQTAFSPEGLQMRRRQAAIEDVQSKPSVRPEDPNNSLAPASTFQFPLSREDLEMGDADAPPESPAPDEGSQHDD